MHAAYEVGVDIGGTFTDVVCRRPGGEVKLVKIPTTRANPSAGVLHAVEHMAREWNIAPQSISRFVHGTTVATNAVLERKGAKIGLITTQGFRDVLEIGRQSRHNVYSVMLNPETPAFLVPGALRREVPGRLAATGRPMLRHSGGWTLTRSMMSGARGADSHALGVQGRSAAGAHTYMRIAIGKTNSTTLMMPSRTITAA